MKSLLALSIFAFIAPNALGGFTFIDKEGMARNGFVVSTQALQGAIDDDSPMVNCLQDAEQDVEAYEKAGFKIAKSECILGKSHFAGMEFNGAYQVVLHNKLPAAKKAAAEKVAGIE